MTGGIRTPSDALVGPVADLTVRSLHFDTLFLGCHGIDPDAGLTTPNLAESETNRTFVKAGPQGHGVADHTKWGIVGLSSFAGPRRRGHAGHRQRAARRGADRAADRVGEIIVANDMPAARAARG